MIKVAIYGATGYTGFELIRLLLSHSGARITALTSEQFADLPLDRAFAPFRGKLGKVTFGKMEQMRPEETDAVFLALPHTVSASVAGEILSRGTRVIDLSADFRLRRVPLYESVYGVRHKTPDLVRKAVYGLPEIYRDSLRKTRLAAVPGCYPMAVILALYPLLAEGLIGTQGIVADCKSGASGAGRGPAPGFHYPEVEGGVRAYGLPRHRHQPEIDQELSLAAGKNVNVTFVPHLLPMVRGILATCYATAEGRVRGKDIGNAYLKHYRGEPFVRICPTDVLPSTKDVSGSNFCDIAWRFDGKSRRVVVVSAIDNLVKGASGSAVQCFNLMMGFPEDEGLRSVPVFP